MHSVRVQSIEAAVNNILTEYFAKYDGNIGQISDLHNIVISNVERFIIQRIMHETMHNKKMAAQILGISRTTLSTKLANYSIKKDEDQIE